MMTEARNLPAAIQWHEGMLLAPQHFQQMSVRHEELLHYHLMMTAPFHWGIRKLRLDQVSLVDGTFRVQELEAVMPDGLIVCYPAHDDKTLETDLRPYEQEMKERPITIHLAVPASKIGSTLIKGSLDRFDSVEGAPVADENTGAELSIPRLMPRLSLQITTEDEAPPQKYSTLPLAKIRYKDENLAQTDFIPPLLSVSRDSAIGATCAAVARKLREKAMFLSERMNASSSGVRGPMILETKLLIRSLVSSLPHFEAILKTGKSHPYPLYLSLCLIVGDMASLGAGLVPPDLPAYDHNAPGSVFERVSAFIFRMIEEGILESHTAVPFDFENGMFSLRVKENWMSRKLVIGVRGKPGSTEENVREWIETSLIGSATQIQSMQDRRILGAERSKIEGDGELVPARGVLLFSVRAKPDNETEEQFIDQDEVLQIFSSSDSMRQGSPSEIMLYVRNRP